MYNFSLTKYYNAKSIIHDINPFYKIICTLIFTILLLFTKNTLLLLLIFLFVILLMSVYYTPIIYFIWTRKII